MESDCFNVAELLNNIFQFLPPKDIFVCRHVCSFWYSIAESFLEKGVEIEYKWYQTHLKFRKFHHNVKSNYNIHLCEGILIKKCFVDQLGMTVIVKKVAINNNSFYYDLLCFDYTGDFFEEQMFKDKFLDDRIEVYSSENEISIYVEKRLKRLFCFSTLAIYGENYFVPKNQILNENSHLNFSTFFDTFTFPRTGTITFPCSNNQNFKLRTTFKYDPSNYSFSITYQGVDFSNLIERVESYHKKTTCLIRFRSGPDFPSGAILFTRDRYFTKWRHFIECYSITRDNHIPVFCPSTKRILLIGPHSNNSLKCVKIDQEFNQSIKSKY